jgi:hypothetical protein
MVGKKDGTGEGRILGVMASGGPLAAHSGNSARIAIYPQVHSEPTSPFFESGLSERANGRENQVKKEKNEWIIVLPLQKFLSKKERLQKRKNLPHQSDFEKFT